MGRREAKSRRRQVNRLIGILALVSGCGAAEGPIPPGADGDTEASSDSGLSSSAEGSGGSQVKTSSDSAARTTGETGGSSSLDGGDENLVAVATTAGGTGGGTGGTSQTGNMGGSGGTGGSGGSGGSVAAPRGERCDDARQILASDEVFAGLDFTADYAGDLDLAEHDTCGFGDNGSSDAVFSVSLEPGARLVASQTGSLEAILSVQSACGEQNACLASARGGAGTNVEYTAAAAETVFVIVDALEVAPSATDYALRIDVDPVCGNGDLEALEACDDAGVEPGDGCSPTCVVEFPFLCSQDSPSACGLPESLGEAGVGETLSFDYDDPFEEGPSLYRIVTFTERVLVDVRAFANVAGTGDIDILVYSDWDTLLVPGVGPGDASRLDEAFEPGTYLLELRAEADLPDGFTVTLTTKSAGTCGDEVVQVGFEECDNGAQEGCPDCKVPFDHACDRESPSTCEAILGLGPYAAEEAIDPITTEAEVVPGVSEYWIVTFSEDVLLSGSVTAPDAGPYQYLTWLKLWSEDSTDEPEFLLDLYYYPTFSDLELPAGTYKIELMSYSGLPAGYELALTTTQP